MREKVIEAARDLGLDVSVNTLETPTRTVQEAAAAVGCDPAQIAKSLVFVADGEPVLCVASGAHRVDLEKLCDAIDCAEARQASPDEVRAATGYSIGGVPPFAHGLHRVIFDEALLRHERVWAAGGDGCTLFEIDPRVLSERIGATVADVAA
jgi:prolyl-tRNA editing enzyme YbaK/EbsC (Cys-tRNA(Pro) deacylase)